MNTSHFDKPVSLVIASRLVCWTMFLGTGLLGHAEASDDIKAKFFREYPGAAARMEGSYRRIKGTCLITRESGNPAEKRVLGARTFERIIFANDHGFRKAERIYENGDHIPQNQVVYCMSDASGYGLRKMHGTEKYSVSRSGMELREVNALYTTTFGRYLNSPFYIITRSLLKYSSSPKFRISSAEEFADHGNQVIRLACEDGDEGRSSKFVVELNSTDWSIRKFVYAPAEFPKSKAAMNVEYGQPIDGIPIPKKVRFVDINGDKILCAFEKVSFDSTPVHEFSMSNYGLPDLSKPAPPGKPGVGFLRWIMLALIGLALAVLFGWISRRYR